MTRKITPLTIRNFGYGFRKSFLRKLKKDISNICSVWYNGVGPAIEIIGGEYDYFSGTNFEPIKQ